MLNRRNFLKIAGSVATAASALGAKVHAANVHVLESQNEPQKPVAANDHIQIALIGALQVWRNYLRDPQGTIQQYRQALSSGATRSLPELYTAAGVRFAFDVTLLQDMVQLVTGKIEELEQGV